MMEEQAEKFASYHMSKAEYTDYLIRSIQAKVGFHMKILIYLAVPLNTILLLKMSQKSPTQFRRKDSNLV